MPQFQLDLYQSHWSRSHTEQFVVEATDEAEAKQKAAEIAKDKGLEEDFDFEINELTNPADDMEQLQAAEQPDGPTDSEVRGGPVNLPDTQAKTTGNADDENDVPPRASSSSS